jgi:hypothetical protein
MIVNSAADWGKSDPLKVPRTAEAMQRAGFAPDAIETVLWHNPIAFFEQSGRLDASLFGAAFDQAELYAGNSVLRGQQPARKGGA